MNYIKDKVNLNITGARLNPNSELVELEINGNKIDLASDVPVYNKLYAWKNDDADTIYAYTAKESPVVGDIAIMPDAATLALDDDPISAIGTDTITAFSTVFERDSTKDIVTVE